MTSYFDTEEKLKNFNKERRSKDEYFFMLGGFINKYSPSYFHSIVYSPEQMQEGEFAELIRKKVNDLISKNKSKSEERENLAKKILLERVLLYLGIEREKLELIPDSSIYYELGYLFGVIEGSEIVKEQIPFDIKGKLNDFINRKKREKSSYYESFFEEFVLLYAEFLDFETNNRDNFGKRNITEMLNEKVSIELILETLGLENWKKSFEYFED